MTVLALPSRKHSSEASLEAYCKALWQTQERAKPAGRPLYIPAIPLLRTDPEILYALFKVECHVSDSWLLIDILWDRILELIEKPDPDAVVAEAWRSAYWQELEEVPKLNDALSSPEHVRLPKALRWITQAAELNPGELEVLRLWLAGDDVRTIARLTHRRQNTIQVVLARLSVKLREARPSRARGGAASG